MEGLIGGLEGWNTRRFVMIWGAAFLILTLATLCLIFLLFTMQLVMLTFVIVWYLFPSMLRSCRQRIWIQIRVWIQLE